MFPVGTLALSDTFVQWTTISASAFMKMPPMEQL
jgi:hypothetical protein